ncbi:MAG: cation transporter [Saprospiraceae bacterium]|nr:cation transporter [Saprospiraceae bacterium]
MIKNSSSIISVQRVVVFVSIILFITKIYAWYLTHSVAILTDALESTVNVVAGFIGLYSLTLSAKPRDRQHPYGHGKIEFITSAFEGMLIAIAGFYIIYEAIDNYLHPHTIKKLDVGIVLVAFSGLVNYVVGYYVEKKGKSQNSPVLIAGGQHLKTDTYSTIGILIGVVLIYITGYQWIDNATAIIFAFVIIFTGYSVMRKSVSGIMDEADSVIIEEVIELLKSNRNPNWVDVHNMRIIDYVGYHHIDCHLTVPFYLNMHEGHKILDELTKLLNKHFENRVEFFIHLDGCLPFQCSICKVENCPERSQPFQSEVEWTFDNIVLDAKHGSSEAK